MSIGYKFQNAIFDHFFRTVFFISISTDKKQKIINRLRDRSLLFVKESIGKP